MEKEKPCRIDINELISEINNYNLSLHKLTYRYGIDYIKYNLEFKEKYPEVIKELSDYYIPRKVIMIQSPSIDNDTIECGNQYEMETMVGILKCDKVVRDGVEYIEDLRCELLSDCDEDEVKEYKDKLTLKINVYGEYINKVKKENLKNGTYLIKAGSKDYSLTKEKEEKINSLEINEEYKDFFKNLFSEEPIPKGSDLLVELVGQNPFLKIKSIKNNDTGEDITKRFTDKDVDDVNCLWTLSKQLEWVAQ